MKTLLDINSNYLMFERSNDEDGMLVAVNRTKNENKINVPSTYEKGNKIYTLKKATPNVLTPYGAVAIKK